MENMSVRGMHRIGMPLRNYCTQFFLEFGASKGSDRARLFRFKITCRSLSVPIGALLLLWARAVAPTQMTLRLPSTLIPVFILISSGACSWSSAGGASRPESYRVLMMAVAISVSLAWRCFWIECRVSASEAAGAMDEEEDELSGLIELETFGVC